ncbi:DNA topoisomerase IB [Ekhidna sp.]|uniref:DNA topoisomerase IB n=1 Tax=Ekhidna sp. TaxID=2608089 RepID=UPI003BABB294
MQNNTSESIDCPPHLVYVTDEEPGLSRIVNGESEIYLDEEGEELVDKEMIGRIQNLVIPPNWKDTWICKLENGHLQCTGRDERNRKQYLYHEDWLEYRQKSKYSRMVEFGESLPEIRKKINKYLEKESFSKIKVLAIAIKLLDLHYLRIGNDFYLSENETYGLTTLRRRHLEKKDGGLELSYKGKSNKYRNISIENRKLVKLLQEVNELPGYEVFRYKEGSERKRIDSADVNEFIRELSDDQFSAKDFRTWGGTVSAVDVYPEALAEVKENPKKKLETAIVRRVSKILGNTVSTAREYYIHPKVLDFLLENGTEIKLKNQKREFFKENEAKVLAILKS